ncbi:MAG: hypothetical protein AAF675_08305, partial [Pseudomonadota bacterium]
SSDWTPEYLKSIGIEVATDDDDRRMSDKEIVLHPQPEAIVIPGYGATGFSIGDPVTRYREGRPPISWDVLVGLDDGARRQFGFLVSQYWVQRQKLLETNFICGILEKAMRRVTTEEVATVEENFVEEYEKLTRRMRDIDRLVWPNVAESVRPIPSRMRGAHPGWTRFPIAEDYAAKTRPARLRLETLDAELRAAIAAQNRSPFASVGPSAVTGSTAELDPVATSAPELLRSEARDILRELSDLVFVYEDAYRQVVSVISATTARVATETDGLDIAPVHLRIPIDPGAGPGPGPSNGTAPLGAEGNLLLDLVAFRNRMQAGGSALSEAEAWRETYFRRIDTQREAFSEALEAYYTWYARKRAAPRNGTLIERPRRVADDPWALALKHPYWQRRLRVLMQLVKLDHAEPAVGDALEAERAQTLKALTIVPPPPGSDAPEGEVEGEGEAQATPPATGDASAIPARRGALTDQAARLMALTRAMFDVAVSISPEEDFAVSDLLQGRITAVTPKSALQGPAGADLQALIKQWRWELVQAGDQPAPLDACSDAVGPRYFWNEVLRPPKARHYHVPLRQHGRYALQLTALGEHDVPLAQLAAPIDLTVAEAYITGEIEVPEPLRAETIGLYLRRDGLAPPPRPRSQLRPVDIDATGRFTQPLCAIHATMLPTPAYRAAANPSVGAADTASASGAQGAQASPWPSYPVYDFSAFAGIARGVTLEPKSLPSAVDFRPRAQIQAAEGTPAAAQFALRDRLRLLSAQVVTVSIEVRDASGAIVPADLALFVQGVERASGPSQQLRLELGDSLEVRARRQTPRGLVEARSEARLYDPDTDKDAIALSLRLPFYEAGNLSVEGRFVPDPTVEGAPSVAGGLVVSAMAGELGVEAGGGFSFTNPVPVRLADGIVLSAMLTGPEGQLLRPRAPRIVRPMAMGGRQDLGALPVSPATVTIAPVEVMAVDWSNTPLPESGTEVMLGGERFARVKDRYTGSAVFSKAGEAIDLRVTHVMPDASLAEEILPLSLDLPALLRAEPIEPLEMRLKIYAAGSLDIAGQVSLRLPDGFVAPEEVTLSVAMPDSPTRLSYRVKPGQAFRETLPEAVRLVRVLKGEAEVEMANQRFAGRASAIVPARLGSGQPTADFGEVVLDLEDLEVSVPDLTGLTLAEAQAAVPRGITVEPALAPRRPPAQAAQVNRIWNQSHYGRQRTGTTVVVEVYDDQLSIPNVTGMRLAEGIAAIETAGFRPFPQALAPDQAPNTPPGRIVAHIPTGRAPPGSAVSVVFVRADAPAPEPEQPPEVTQPEATEPVIAESAAEPAAPSPDPTRSLPLPEGSIGPFVGDLRATGLVVNNQSHDAQSFFAFVMRQMEREIAEEAAEMRRERAQSSADGGSVARALGEAAVAVPTAIMDGIGDAIMLGITVGLRVVTEMAFQGVQAGFVLAPAGDGAYRIVVPGMPEAYASNLELLPLLRTEDGRLFSGVQRQDAPSGSFSIALKVQLAENLDRASVELVAKGRNTAPPDPDGFDLRSASMALEGELASGTASFPALLAAGQQVFERKLVALEPQIMKLIDTLKARHGMD